MAPMVMAPPPGNMGMPKIKGSLAITDDEINKLMAVSAAQNPPKRASPRARASHARYALRLLASGSGWMGAFDFCRVSHQN